MEERQRMLTAVVTGDVATVTSLLARHPELAASHDSNGVSVLLNALYHRQTSVASLLAAHLGRLSVFEAAALGDVAGLTAAEDEINSIASDGFSPLHLAAFFARDEACIWLIETGADIEVEARNATCVRPLHSAVAGGSPVCVEALLDAGAGTDAAQAGGYTPLMGAAAAGHEAMVQRLLAAGAGRSLVTEDGRTAADLAQAAGHENLAAELSN